MELLAGFALDPTDDPCPPTPGIGSVCVAACLAPEPRSPPLFGGPGHLVSGSPPGEHGVPRPAVLELPPGLLCSAAPLSAGRAWPPFRVGEVSPSCCQGCNCPGRVGPGDRGHCAPSPVRVHLLQRVRRGDERHRSAVPPRLL